MTYLNRKSGLLGKAAPIFGIGLAILALILLVAPVREAAACTPASLPSRDYKSAMKIIRASAAVFIGTVISSSNNPPDHSYTYARIKVETVWKGKLAKQVKVYAARFSVCRMRYAELFPKGTRFLVFAIGEGSDVYRVIDSYWIFENADKIFYKTIAPAAVMRALKDYKAGS